MIFWVISSSVTRDLSSSGLLIVQYIAICIMIHMHCIVVYRDTALALISNAIFHCVYHQDISGMISTHFVERLRVN